jgi:membrane protein DedA with SNARE-associated domain
MGLLAAAHPAVPSALSGLPTAVAVAALCLAVAVEIIVIPGMLLPGGTVTLIAGALIGSGRPVLAVAVPMVIAVIGADQLAYLCGAVLIDWLRRRHPARAERGGAPLERTANQGRPVGQGRTAIWLTAAMPTVAGAVRMPYRAFAVRLIILRVPWLAGALSAGTLAAKWLGDIGHVVGVGGVAASLIVLACLLLARHRPGAVRALARGTGALRKRKTSTLS